MKLTDQPVRYALAANPSASWMVHLESGQYENGRIALELMSAEEPHGEDHDQDEITMPGERVGVATVNLADAPLAPECVYVKDYSENEGMVDWLIKQDIIEPQPLDKVESGFVTIRSYRLTPAVLAKLAAAPADPEPQGATVQYLVTLTLKPGLSSNDAPAEDAILGALEVGTEGAPDGMRFEGVEEIHVQEKGTNFYTLDDREHATVLAALRYWQRHGMPCMGEHNLDVDELTTSEIDALCERLNCGG